MHHAPRLAARLLTAFGLAAASAGLATPALAAEPYRPFGSRGQVVLSDIVAVRSGGIGFLGVGSGGGVGALGGPSLSGLIGYAHDRTLQSQGPGVAWEHVSNTVSATPSLDLFVTNRLSIGATLGFSWTRADSRYVGAEGSNLGSSRTTSYAFGLAPRIGYVIPLGAGFSLWPRVGAGLTVIRQRSESIAPMLADGTYGYGNVWTGGADLGVVFRPTRHLYFSATPELAVVYARQEQQTQNQMLFQSAGVRVRVSGTLGMGVLLGT